MSSRYPGVSVGYLRGGNYMHSHVQALASAGMLHALTALTCQTHLLRVTEDGLEVAKRHVQGKSQFGSMSRQKAGP